jgi:hypothetical protein
LVHKVIPSGVTFNGNAVLTPTGAQEAGSKKRQDHEEAESRIPSDWREWFSDQLVPTRVLSRKGEGNLAVALLHGVNLRPPAKKSNGRQLLTAWRAPPLLIDRWEKVCDEFSPQVLPLTTVVHSGDESVVPPPWKKLIRVADGWVLACSK